MKDLHVGDDVYVREPQRFVPGCISITGPIASIQGDQCTLSAWVCLPWVKGVGSGSGNRTITVPLSEVGRRTGTPISALSGRPGHPGFAEFSRIARSWGYD